MKRESDAIETFSAETDYDEVYRFRLWVAAVEDSDSLGMGFRAYHSHIVNSLVAWQRSGTQFLTAMGQPQVFDLLTPDDLYGFLGKKTEDLSGPGRKIKNYKLAVIDLFFKRKFPDLSKSFGSPNLAGQISYTLKAFYQLPQNPRWDHKQVTNEISYFPAVFLPREKEVIEAFDPLSQGPQYVYSWGIKYQPASRHYIVHIVGMPLHPDFVIEGSQLHDKLNHSMFVPLGKAGEGAVIHGGAGVAVRDSNQTIIQCLLRERTTRSPSTPAIQFGVLLNHGEGQSLHSAYVLGAGVGQRVYDNLQDERNNGRLNFFLKDKYLDVVNNIHNSLGMEI